MKYKVNSFYYLKKDIGTAKTNEMVKIVRREKKAELRISPSKQNLLLSFTMSVLNVCAIARDDLYMR